MCLELHNYYNYTVNVNFAPSLRYLTFNASYFDVRVKKFFQDLFTISFCLWIACICNINEIYKMQHNPHKLL